MSSERRHIFNRVNSSHFLPTSGRRSDWRHLLYYRLKISSVTLFVNPSAANEGVLMFYILRVSLIGPDYMTAGSPRQACYNLNHQCSHFVFFFFLSSWPASFCSTRAFVVAQHQKMNAQCLHIHNVILCN